MPSHKMRVVSQLIRLESGRLGITDAIGELGWIDMQEAGSTK